MINLAVFFYLNKIDKIEFKIFFNQPKLLIRAYKIKLIIV
jgi:hypothetical protein